MYYMNELPILYDIVIASLKALLSFPSSATDT